MKQKGTLFEDKAKHNNSLPHDKPEPKPFVSDWPDLPPPSESKEFISLLKVMGVVVAIMGVMWAIKYLEVALAK